MSKEMKWEIGVFPFCQENGKTVSWNSVVRRQGPQETHWTIQVLPEQSSPRRAEAAALRQLRKLKARY